ncbi:sialate O-acetylesterase [Leeuwenhoekiella sp. W20_SRS_FM14]|uniref:sialate O-acetylesterase n=1 Tax=Leeuwenhoekiella sp. W20_SRS_FM14 TaxID=3240270 RepID=UPI003F9BCD5F
MNTYIFRSTNSILVCLFMLFSIFRVEAQLKLPKLVSDGMVVQRNTEINIWGYADAGAPVMVSFLGKQKKVKTNEAGTWLTSFKTPNQAEASSITITSASETLTVDNVLVGDVYLCSGQSNMELPMSRVKPLYEEEIATANFPDIRYFEVPKIYDFSGPQLDLPGGKWVAVNSATIEDISAVAYFFSKEIHLDQNVPVGIINASLGGSPIESWLDYDALKSFPGAQASAQKFKSNSYRDSIATSDTKRQQDWYSKLNNADNGLKNNWKSGEFEISNWDSMQIPGYWAETNLGALNGVVWFTKTVNLPKELIGKAAHLEMGRIVDADSIFINGTFIGNTTYQYPPRRYEIPKGILKEKNQLVVRVINEQGRGGFVEDKDYEIRFEDTVIDLKGTWQYKLGALQEPLASPTFIRWKPTGLYNAMINPLLNYKIAGMLWYQGESNVSNADEYDELIKILVTDWRSKWGQGDTPFLLVQLANFLKSYEEPTESDWAKMRESQEAVLDLKNTAMAVLIDVGEWNDIHPLNKKDVGHRLALGAKKLVYHKDVVSSGPRFKSLKIEDNKAIVHYDLFNSSIQIQGAKPQGFAVAGADGKFYWAEAQVVGNTIVLTSEQVSKPVYVRYAWADNPDTANVFNTQGLPALPFRTDK